MQLPAFARRCKSFLVISKHSICANMPAVRLESRTAPEPFHPNGPSALLHRALSLAVTSCVHLLHWSGHQSDEEQVAAFFKLLLKRWSDILLKILRFLLVDWIGGIPREASKHSCHLVVGLISGCQSKQCPFASWKHCCQGTFDCVLLSPHVLGWASVKDLCLFVCLFWVERNVIWLKATSWSRCSFAGPGQEVSLFTVWDEAKCPSQRRQVQRVFHTIFYLFIDFLLCLWYHSFVSTFIFQFSMKDIQIPNKPEIFWV